MTETLQRHVESTDDYLEIKFSDKNDEKTQNSEGIVS